MRKAGFRKVAKGYQEYREKRAKARELSNVLDILSNEATEEKTIMRMLTVTLRLEDIYTFLKM